MKTVRRRKDGSLVNVSLSVSPLKDASGRVTGASKIARDITQQKHAEQRNQGAGGSASRNGSPQGRVPRDLVARAAQSARPDSPGRRDQRNGQSLGRSAPLGDGRDSPRRCRPWRCCWTICSMSRALRVRHCCSCAESEANLAEMHQGRHRDARVRSSMRAGTASRCSHPRAECVFQADPLRLAQVLSNPAHERRQVHTPGGTIRLIAEVDECAIVIRVEDNGIGIAPADILPRIFTMFSQAPEAQEHAEGGLGIGLALAERARRAARWHHRRSAQGSVAEARSSSRFRTARCRLGGADRPSIRSATVPLQASACWWRTTTVTRLTAWPCCCGWRGTTSASFTTA